MVCAITKIDSNDTGLALAEEECIGKLRQSGVYSDVIWHVQEPNTYNPTPGATYTRVARQPINRSHKRKKGNIVDRDATFGDNFDLTPNSFTWRSQGAFNATATVPATTDPLNAPNILFTGVDVDTHSFIAAAGLGIFAAGNLVVARGFAWPGNNGLASVTSATGAGVVVAGLADMADEPSPPAVASLEVVGHRFASGGLTLTLNASGLVLFAGSALPASVAALKAGQWIFIGGDVPATRFNDVQVGFARIKSIVGQTITLDKADFIAASVVGTGKTIDLYFGPHVRDEPDPDDIVRRSYSAEMTLGNDAAGVQSQYIDGAVMNVTTINSPLAGLVTIDQTFLACNRVVRDGTDGLRGGSYAAPVADEYAYNTTSDEVRIQLAPLDNLAGTGLIGIINNFTLSFNNNITANKGQGILGPFNMTWGDLAVAMTANVYFTDVDAMTEIPNNTTFSFDAIYAANNTAVAFDVPELTLGDGSLEVVKDQPIMLNLNNDGHESAFGTTASVSFFRYVPDIGMPAPDAE
jgi:hypothetical protein